MCLIIPELLEKSSILYGERIAFEDVDNQITFVKLFSDAMKIASLFNTEVKNGQPVAIIMKKSVDAIRLMCGVVCAGGAYCFIDPEQPESRMNSMIESLRPALVIVDESLSINVCFDGTLFSSEFVFSEIENNKVNYSLIQNRWVEMSDRQPLYINFTSGSTGKPKGVAISHRSVLDFIPNFTDVMGIDDKDIIGNQAPLDFDVSVKDIYSCLYKGAKVVLIPREYFVNPKLLMDYICDRNISVLIWAVSALCFITIMKGLEYRCPDNIRIIGFSGECMPIKHLNKLRKYLIKTRFINLYGPTEITCNCTYYEIPRNMILEEGDVLPIGRAFRNKKVFLLNEGDELIESSNTNSIGEVCVSGECVALGYYGNEEKTKEAFVQNPLNSDYIEIMYKTGDLAEYNKFGELVYVGRKDSQIKHMGHRIELGEIESAFMHVEGVERAACFYLHDKSKLVIFYSGSAVKEEILAVIKMQLPAYMIPNKINRLDEMPVNAHGKIDRAALKGLL